MTTSTADLADALSRMIDKARACPPGDLTVHEIAVIQSALQTLAGVLGSLEWRLREEATALELERERAQAFATAPEGVTIEGPK